VVTSILLVPYQIVLPLFFLISGRLWSVWHLRLLLSDCQCGACGDFGGPLRLISFRLFVAERQVGFGAGCSGLQFLLHRFYCTG
jgi:hypothetical protein